MNEKTAAQTAEDIGKLVLRLVLGILILFHGVSKVMGGPAFIVKTVTDVGLPGFLGYLVYIGEVIAPLLLIAGIWTRVMAAIIAINMVTAISLVHTQQFLTINNTGGWALELQGMYLFTAIAIILLGGGRYIIARHADPRKWN